MREINAVVIVMCARIECRTILLLFNIKCFEPRSVSYIKESDRFIIPLCC